MNEIRISKDDLRELLEQAFEEGWESFLELKGEKVEQILSRFQKKREKSKEQASSVFSPSVFDTITDQNNGNNWRINADPASYMFTSTPSTGASSQQIFVSNNTTLT